MGFPLPPSPGATCDPGGGSPAIGRATTGPTAALEKQSHAYRGLVEVRDLNGSLHGVTVMVFSRGW